MRIANLFEDRDILAMSQEAAKRLWLRTDIWSPKSTADFVNVPKV